MKIKMFALVALMSATTFASAQSVSIGYAARELKSGTQEHQTSLSVKTAAYGAFTGDAAISAVQNDSTNAITNRSEVGVTYGMGLPFGLTGATRFATGWKAKSGSDVTTYYVVEPSVTAQVGTTPLSVKLGYRLREAYDDSVADNSKTTRLAVGYNLTKNDKISLGRDLQRGDGALSQTSLQYTRAF